MASSSSSPSPSGGFVPDLATCRLMTVNEKRALVCELSKFHLSAPEELQEWSRREIIEVLCAELGKEQKERTFSSMPKHKLLDFLFKVVSGESSYPRKHKETKSIPEPKAINEKRELVRGLSNCHRSAPEQLQEWSRREILEVLCAELGKERKERTFSSMPKRKLLDFLFKVVNGESFHPLKHKKRNSIPEPNAVNLPPTSKRQKKKESAALLPVRAGTGLSAPRNNAQLCHNSACKATLNPEDKFCKRCTCCICFKYDANKDPTLWLFCNSDQSLQEDSCGFSCHLECALEDERSGILQSGQSKKLDGDYFCIQCGKQNDLLRCWRKQLWVAKDARRLDVLCHRIFLCHKILISTKRYMVLHEIVEKAMKKLEDELGPITGTLDVGHGLVCCLAVGAEVQKLCICAIESFESLFSNSLTADLRIQRSCITHCEPTSKSQNIKHGNTGEVDELEKFPRAAAAVFDDEEEMPRSDSQEALLRKSSSLMAYNRVTLKQNLEMIFSESETTTLANTGNMLVAPPEYSESLLHILGRGTINLKGVTEKSFEEAISGDQVSQNCCLKTEMDQESLSYKTSLGGFDDDREDKDGSLRRDTTVPTSLPRESSDLIYNNVGALHKLNADASRLKNASGVLAEIGNGITLGNETGATSFKSETDYQIPQPSKPETEPGTSSNKNLSGKYDEISREDGCSEASYEYCVKVIRRLECEGYICADSRLNFLTWFCLRATRHDKRTVSVFVDTLIDDPASLADQLLDTFSDAIRRKGQPRGPFIFGVELRP
ncbi:hypothetical protein EJB05_42062 [Eragrostis curvula]|uniref:Uncharacterized protein n=1 Tax=Eragrostis curvula TaxID=38414 RepID=A0A5J9TDF4_9POAL|nr:hypothetical protein EJB05_42062 [Eragrostis curvula]